MAAKADAKESKESTPPTDKAGAAPVESVASTAGSSALKAWLPAVLAIVLAPAASYGVAQFVVLPRLQKKLAAPPAQVADNTAAASSEGGEKGKDGKDAGKDGGATYEFSNVVVNLAGTMGTRYLKTSFVVTGAEKNANIKAQFEAQKPKFTDITLNVLSSLTLADLEEPGAKNVLREKLVATYNQAFGKRVVDQVYFSDFVIQ
jgi:flagellar FliL protein